MTVRQLPARRNEAVGVRVAGQPTRSRGCILLSSRRSRLLFRPCCIVLHSCTAQPPACPVRMRAVTGHAIQHGLGYLAEERPWRRVETLGMDVLQRLALQGNDSCAELFPCV